MDFDSINWTKIGQAVDFYKRRGFIYIETPWIVDVDNLFLTCNDLSRIVTTDIPHTGLVGSAEQSFIQLVLENKLDGTNFVSAGPCFRYEQPFDKLHQLQFFKVELFVKCNSESEAIFATKEVLNSANKFMYQANAKETDEGFDLEINGIEVGRYGYRYADGVGWWTYGTGLAEPRYSQALASI